MVSEKTCMEPDFCVWLHGNFDQLVLVQPKIEGHVIWWLVPWLWRHTEQWQALLHIFEEEPSCCSWICCCLPCPWKIFSSSLHACVALWPSQQQGQKKGLSVGRGVESAPMLSTAHRAVESAPGICTNIVAWKWIVPWNPHQCCGVEGWRERGICTNIADRTVETERGRVHGAWNLLLEPDMTISGLLTGDRVKLYVS